MVTRIRQLLDWQQLSPTQFADLIGVGRPVVSHILSERNKPSLEVVQRIIAAFPAVSLPWLLSGSGAMLAATDMSRPVAAAATVAPAVPGEGVELTQFSAPKPPASAVAAAPRRDEVGMPAPVASSTFVAPATAPLSTALNYSAAAPPVPTSPAGPAPARFVASRPRVAAAAPLASPLAPAVTPQPLAVVPGAFAAPQLEPQLANYPAAAPVAAVPAAPAALPSVVVPATNSTQPNAADAAALLPFLGEPGKAIRRIVIFYRDGSFADYQPEA